MKAAQKVVKKKSSGVAVLPGKTHRLHLRRRQPHRAVSWSGATQPAVR